MADPKQPSTVVQTTPPPKQVQPGTVAQVTPPPASQEPPPPVAAQEPVKPAQTAKMDADFKAYVEPGAKGILFTDPNVAGIIRHPGKKKLTSGLGYNEDRGTLRVAPDWDAATTEKKITAFLKGLSSETRNQPSGSTLTMVVTTNDGKIVVGNLGDSPAYAVAHNASTGEVKFIPIYEDHSVPETNGKKNNAITRHLGQGSSSNPAVHTFDPKTMVPEGFEVKGVVAASDGIFDPKASKADEVKRIEQETGELYKKNPTAGVNDVSKMLYERGLRVANDNIIVVGMETPQAGQKPMAAVVADGIGMRGSGTAEHAVVAVDRMIAGERGIPNAIEAKTYTAVAEGTDIKIGRNSTAVIDISAWEKVTVAVDADGRTKAAYTNTQTNETKVIDHDFSKPLTISPDEGSGLRTLHEDGAKATLRMNNGQLEFALNDYPHPDGKNCVCEITTSPKAPPTPVASGKPSEVPQELMRKALGSHVENPANARFEFDRAYNKALEMVRDPDNFNQQTREALSKTDPATKAVVVKAYLDSSKSQYNTGFDVVADLRRTGSDLTNDLYRESCFRELGLDTKGQSAAKPQAPAVATAQPGTVVRETPAPKAQPAPTVTIAEHANFRNIPEDKVVKMIAMQNDAQIRALDPNTPPEQWVRANQNSELVQKSLDKLYPSIKISGYGNGKDMTAAIDAARTSGQKFSFITIDGDNFGGMAKQVNSPEQTRAHEKAMVDITKKALAKQGVEVQVFRPTPELVGDEYGLVAKGAPEKVQAGLEAAKAEIEAYAKANGLNDLPYRKDGAGTKSAGLSFGTEEITSQKTAQQIMDNAEGKLKAAKTSPEVQANNKPATSVQPTPGPGATVMRETPAPTAQPATVVRQTPAPNAQPATVVQTTPPPVAQQQATVVRQTPVPSSQSSTGSLVTQPNTPAASPAREYKWTPVTTDQVVISKGYDALAKLDASYQKALNAKTDLGAKFFMNEITPKLVDVYKAFGHDATHVPLTKESGKSINDYWIMAHEQVKATEAPGAIPNPPEFRNAQSLCNVTYHASEAYKPAATAVSAGGTEVRPNFQMAGPLSAGQGSTQNLRQGWVPVPDDVVPIGHPDLLDAPAPRGRNAMEPPADSKVVAKPVSSGTPATDTVPLGHPELLNNVPPEVRAAIEAIKQQASGKTTAVSAPQPTPPSTQQSPAAKEEPVLREVVKISVEDGRNVAGKLMQQDPKLMSGVEAQLQKMGVSGHLVELGEGKQKITFGVTEGPGFTIKGPQDAAAVAATPPKYAVSIMPTSEYALSAEIPLHTKGTLPPAYAVLVKADGTSQVLTGLNDLPKDMNNPTYKGAVVVAVTPYVVDKSKLTSQGLTEEQVEKAQAQTNEKFSKGDFRIHDGEPQWGITPEELAKARADKNYVPKTQIYDLGDVKYTGKPSAADIEAATKARAAEFPIYSGTSEEQLRMLRETNVASSTPSQAAKPASAVPLPEGIIQIKDAKTGNTKLVVEFHGTGERTDPKTGLTEEFKTDQLDLDSKAKANLTKYLKDIGLEAASKVEIITPEQIEKLPLAEKVQILEAINKMSLAESSATNSPDLVSNQQLLKKQETFQKTFEAIAKDPAFVKHADQRIALAMEATTPAMAAELKKWESGDKAYDPETKEGLKNREKLIRDIAKSQAEKYGLKAPDVHFTDLEGRSKGMYMELINRLDIEETMLKNASPRDLLTTVTHEMGHADQKHLVSQLNEGKIPKDSPLYEVARALKLNTDTYVRPNSSAPTETGNGRDSAKLATPDEAKRFDLYEKQPTEYLNDQNAKKLTATVMGEEPAAQPNQEKGKAPVVAEPTERQQATQAKPQLPTGEKITAVPEKPTVIIEKPAAVTEKPAVNAPRGSTVAAKGNTLVTVAMEAHKLSHAPDPVMGTYLSATTVSTLHSLATGSRVTGTLGAGLMVPLDLASAYDAMKRDKPGEAAASLAQAANGTVGAYAIYTGSAALGSATLIIGLPIAAVATNQQIKGIIEDAQKEGEALDKKLFSPGIAQKFVEFSNKYIDSDNREMVRYKDGFEEKLPKGLKVPLREVPMPQLTEYAQLSKVRGRFGIKGTTPDEIEKELNEQKKSYEKKRDEAIATARDDDVVKDYSRPLFAELTKDKIPELMKTREGRTELKLLLNDAWAKDLKLKTPDYNRLIDKIDAIEINEDNVRMAQGALVELKGTENGTFTVGKNKLPSFESRYNAIKQMQDGFANALPAMEEQLKKQTAELEAFEKDPTTAQLLKTNPMPTFSKEETKLKAMQEFVDKNPNNPIGKHDLLVAKQELAIAKLEASKGYYENVGKKLEEQDRGLDAQSQQTSGKQVQIKLPLSVHAKFNPELVEKYQGVAGAIDAENKQYTATMSGIKTKMDAEKKKLMQQPGMTEQKAMQSESMQKLAKEWLVEKNRHINEFKLDDKYRELADLAGKLESAEFSMQELKERREAIPRMEPFPKGNAEREAFRRDFIAKLSKLNADPEAMKDMLDSTSAYQSEQIAKSMGHTSPYDKDTPANQYNLIAKAEYAGVDLRLFPNVASQINKYYTPSPEAAARNDNTKLVLDAAKPRAPSGMKVKWYGKEQAIEEAAADVVKRVTNGNIRLTASPFIGTDGKMDMNPSEKAFIIETYRQLEKEIALTDDPKIKAKLERGMKEMTEFAKKPPIDMKSLPDVVAAVEKSRETTNSMASTGDKTQMGMGGTSVPMGITQDGAKR